MVGLFFSSNKLNLILFFLRCFFSGQIFRQATRIPDARGGRAPNSHGGFNPGTQRKEGSAFEKWSKTREPSKMGGVGSTLAYLRLELPHRPHGQVLPRKIFFEAKMKFSVLYNLGI